MKNLHLASLPGPRLPGPAVLLVMDGVGWGRRDDGDAVFMAHTPNLDRLVASCPTTFLQAHGTAVGLPSDEDMGNSEVGHNALGAGRVFDQGAKLVDRAVADGRIFGTDAWRALTACPTMHLLGLVSDGNVHSNVRQLEALIRGAARDGVRRLRVHVLTDGRDVPERSALVFVRPLEALLAELSVDGRDFRIGSGGGRMHVTMDRYEADWGMVKRGWDCHVHGVGRAFASATEAIETLYVEDPRITDQFLPSFVIVEHGVPLGRVEDGDAVVFFNFRGDRALEISRVFEDLNLPVSFDRRGPDGRSAPRVVYAGLMEYDGDLHIPPRFLVEPPAIDCTVADYLAANGVSSFAISETQKFGHVTYFFNGNRSDRRDLEVWQEIPSDQGDFDKSPQMKAPEIADAVLQAIASKKYREIRLNLANGDMVGHTGNWDAVVQAMEVVDACVGQVEAAVRQAGGVMLVTADHGNADQMFEVSKKTGAYALGKDGQRKVRTAHSLNPVPFILVDPSGRYRLDTGIPKPGLAHVSGALLALVGLAPPSDWLPSIVMKT